MEEISKYSQCSAFLNTAVTCVHNFLLCAKQNTFYLQVMGMIYDISKNDINTGYRMYVCLKYLPLLPPLLLLLISGGGSSDSSNMYFSIFICRKTKS
jgi:hypothetical protein